MSRCGPKLGSFSDERRLKLIKKMLEDPRTSYEKQKQKEMQNED